MVQYNSKIERNNLEPGSGIIITLQDQEEHTILLSGITAAMRLSIQCEHKENEDHNRLLGLVRLLEALLPDENQLKYGVEYKRPKAER